MYKYNVFISYKRKGDSEIWTNKVFYPIVQNYFIDTLGKNIAFKDTIEQEENYGNSVENFLNNGLIYSRCMIAILIPPYFCQSDWCVREFSVMKFRADQYKKRLLFPVIFTEKKDKDISLLKHACPNLSNHIEKTYMPLFLKEEKYYRFNKAFLEGDNYNKLRLKIRGWLQDSVLPAITSAPPWEQDWSTENWHTDPYKNFKHEIDCQPIYEQFKNPNL